MISVVWCRVGQVYALVSLQVAGDLLLHSERNAFEGPCHLRRVAALVQRSREGGEMICIIREHVQRQSENGRTLA